MDKYLKWLAWKKRVGMTLQKYLLEEKLRKQSYGKCLSLPLDKRQKLLLFALWVKLNWPVNERLIGGAVVLYLIHPDNVSSRQTPQIPSDLSRCRCYSLYSNHPSFFFVPFFFLHASSISPLSFRCPTAVTLFVIPSNSFPILWLSSASTAIVNPSIFGRANIRRARIGP